MRPDRNNWKTHFLEIKKHNTNVCLYVDKMYVIFERNNDNRFCFNLKEFLREKVIKS